MLDQITSEQDKKLRAAKKNAYCLLRSRPRSESEMRARLKLKRYDELTIEAVIQSFKAAGEIDDVKFADYWVESRMNVNPAGEALLRRELKDKDLSDAVIDSAMRNRSETYDEYTVALKIAEESFNKLRGERASIAKRRVYGRLLRRGFDYDIAKRVIDKAIDENG